MPVGKAYRIWPVQLSGPCKKKLKLLVRHVPCPVLSIDPGVAHRALHNTYSLLAHAGVVAR